MKTSLASQTAAIIDGILAEAAADARTMLFEHEVYRILTTLGLKTPRAAMIRDVHTITPQTLAPFAGPRIVMKVAAPGMAHKMTAGGVRMVPNDLEFVRYMFTRMVVSVRERGYAPAGVLLVEEIDYSKDLGNEVLLGFRESEAFGPLLSFSKGGSDAEHFARHFSPPNLILAPIDRTWARALLNSTHIYRKYMAQGRRQYIQALVEAGVRLSEVAVNFSRFFCGTDPLRHRRIRDQPFCLRCRRPLPGPGRVRDVRPPVRRSRRRRRPPTARGCVRFSPPAGSPSWASAAPTPTNRATSLPPTCSGWAAATFTASMPGGERS
jgi:hypothetical protein